MNDLLFVGYDPEVLQHFWREVSETLEAWIRDQKMPVNCYGGWGDRYAYPVSQVNPVWKQEFCTVASMMLVRLAYARPDIPDDIRKWRIGANFDEAITKRRIHLFAIDPAGGEHEIAPMAGMV